MTVTALALTSCGGASRSETPWIVDRFDDIKVIRYEVPGFEQLPLEEKELIYYLAEATKCGRDILFDQNFKYNLAVRRTLETVFENYEGDRTTAEWKALEKYLKKVWFANGIHHHYSNDKFVPEFTEGYLLDVIETIPEEKFGELNPLRGEVCKAIFDASLYKTRLNQTAGEDLIATSSNNYYEGVTQAEVEKFYADMADPHDPEPISYGLNSKLVKEDGVVRERVWKIGGMYSPAIEKIVYWLEKAQAVATEPQKSNIAALIEYYKTGDLREFDRYNIGWVKDGLFGQVLAEIQAVKAACQGRVLKVIIETCLLTQEEKCRLCQVVSDAGADYIKTSTGFSTGGATREDVALLRQHTAPQVKVKAAGGIATKEDAEAFLALGADRLGTSRLVKLAKEAGL